LPPRPPQEVVGSAVKNATVWRFLQALSPKQGAQGGSRRPTKGDYATGLGNVRTSFLQQRCSFLPHQKAFLLY
jgi:hypothetical protein